MGASARCSGSEQVRAPVRAPSRLPRSKRHARRTRCAADHRGAQRPVEQVREQEAPRSRRAMSQPVPSTPVERPIGMKCRPTVRKPAPSVRAGRPMIPGAVPSALGESLGRTGAAITGTNSCPRAPLHEGPRMQPVGGEHALAVEHPTRSRFRTADPAVRAANDWVQPKRDRPRRERPSGLTPTGPASSVSSAFISRDFASQFCTWPIEGDGRPPPGRLRGLRA